MVTQEPALDEEGDDMAEDPPAEEDEAAEDEVADEKPEEEAVADEPTEDPPTEEETAVDEDPADAGIGTPVEVGDLSLTVTDVETGVASVGDSIWDTKANGEFVIVSFTITNNGSSPESIFSDDFMLINDAGAEFATSSDAWHVEDYLVWEEINPGNSFTGVLIYDVPTDTNVTGLEVSVGWFGTPVSVDLTS